MAHVVSPKVAAIANPRFIDVLVASTSHRMSANIITPDPNPQAKDAKVLIA